MASRKIGLNAILPAFDGVVRSGSSFSGTIVMSSEMECQLGRRLGNLIFHIIGLEVERDFVTFVTGANIHH